MKAAIAAVVAAVLLLGTGALGVYNATNEWAGAHTLLQKSVTGGCFVYGVLGLIAGAGVVMRRRWGVPFTIAWGVVATYVATAAVIAYGNADASVGGAAGTAGGSVVVVAFVTWLAYVATRPQVRSEAKT